MSDIEARIKKLTSYCGYASIAYGPRGDSYIWLMTCLNRDKSDAFAINGSTLTECLSNAESVAKDRGWKV